MQILEHQSCMRAITLRDDDEVHLTFQNIVE